LVSKSIGHITNQIVFEDKKGVKMSVGT